MDRIDLLNTLNLAKPALAQKDVVPVFTHFCFTGEVGTVYAYNDIIGIELECDLGIEAAIKGDKLLGILENSRGKTLEVTQKKEEVTIKCGRGKFTFPILSSDAFVFEVPNTDKAEQLDVNEDFLNGLKLCSKTTTTNEAAPVMMGVTVSLGIESYLYSSDMRSLSRYQVLEEVSFKKESSYILPTDFCISLVHMSKAKGALPEVFLTDNFVVAYFGNDLILGRLITPDDAPNFAETIEGSVSDDEMDSMVKIPGALDGALKRSMVFTGSDKEPAIPLSIKGKNITLSTHNQEGLGNDPVPFKGGLPDINVKVNTILLARGIGMCTEFLINDTVVAMRDGNKFFHMIANVTDEFT